MDAPKIIAMYLPQYYRTKENDEWWGEGYTEWTAVKGAKKLYEGHIQPKVPLNDNYYCLLDKTTVKWQADLMQKYGVYGMCFYHYYFGNGRMVLEKPAENLLEWQDISMPYCFSWANDTWARSWSNLVSRKNDWNIQLEKKDSTDGILILQEYGDESDWIEHFMYLLPFFKDERYIKKNGKPIFLLYNASGIPCLKEMIDCWQTLATRNGLLGIYFISQNEANTFCDEHMYMEPRSFFKRNLLEPFTKTGVSTYIGYDNFIDDCLLQYKKKDYGLCCVTPGYDDTPRRGRKGAVIGDTTPEKFYVYLKEALEISNHKKNDFLFINAWNEWGEGNYLEPDSINKYSYLEAVRDAILNFNSDYKIDNTANNLAEKLAESYEKRLSRSISYYRVFDKWMTLKEHNVSMNIFFEKKNISKIAVYGMGMMGRHFVAEIKGKIISYGIDRSIEGRYFDFPIYELGENLPEVDAIVIAVTYDLDVIEAMLEECFSCPKYRIEYIIDELIGQI